MGLDDTRNDRMVTLATKIESVGMLIENARRGKLAIESLDAAARLVAEVLRLAQREALSASRRGGRDEAAAR